MTKEQKLTAALSSYGSVCIGYSGGVDSAFLAVAAVDAVGSANVLAVTGRSVSYPEVQWAAARRVAEDFGVPHLEIDTDELSDENYRANPTNRCYFCKSELWTKLAQVAKAHGLSVLIDGSNADDAADYRPGARAAREHDVQSPLMDAGLTKPEIRDLSRARGLPTWDQPSAPCLSSRLPYGLRVTPERLQQVEDAERIVRDMGFREFRVRHHGSVARLEFARAEIAAAADSAAELDRCLRLLGFGRVLLDVEGFRSGALNEPAPLVQIGATTPMMDLPRAGDAADIAIVAQPLDALDEVRTGASALKQNGIRFITIDLNAARKRA